MNLTLHASISKGKLPENVYTNIMEFPFSIFIWHAPHKPTDKPRWEEALRADYQHMAIYAVNFETSWEEMCALRGRCGILLMFADQSHSIPEICAALGISRATLSRYVKETDPPT